MGPRRPSAASSYPSSDAELRATWAHWLREYRWNHVADLTFRYRPVSIPNAFARLTDWAHGLAWIAQGPVGWAAFPEPADETFRHFHLHALLIGSETVRVGEMTRRWREKNGDQVRIDPYRPDLGVEFYITKWVSAAFSEGAFSDRFEEHWPRQPGERPPAPDVEG